MEINLPASWRQALSSEFGKPYFHELIQFVKSEYDNHTCYPPSDQIFSAFSYCDFDDVKVVIIGQDPYHGANQAHGLCFSVNDTIAFPPSLRNIFKEIEINLGKEAPSSGKLEHWARQGVLLLNATLTVREGEAGSHQKKGWEKFTDTVIQILSDEKENVVFLLWGGYAKKKGAKIDKQKHLVLESGHPSPLSANSGHWFGNKHFSKTNEYLESQGKIPIHW
ncbi:MAG TPA: uracil-DNA glycosylase [Flavobacterium sp.]